MYVSPSSQRSRNELPHLKRRLADALEFGGYGRKDGVPVDKKKFVDG
jgi:hypothetical protein